MKVAATGQRYANNPLLKVSRGATATGSPIRKVCGNLLDMLTASTAYPGRPVAYVAKPGADLVIGRVHHVTPSGRIAVRVVWDRARLTRPRVRVFDAVRVHPWPFMPAEGTERVEQTALLF